jgi:hypothetical protein
MEKDEIGFDLALISKFVTKKKKVCGQRKIFVINSFVNGRLIISTIKATHSLHSFVLFKQFRLLIAFINKLVY